MNLANSNKKLLIGAHTFLGLVCLILFYITTYFGSITLFLPYIKAWEAPSRHFEISKEYSFNIDSELDTIVKEHNLLTKQIEITVPSLRDPALAINVPNQTTLYINPNTNEVLKSEYEKNTVTNFFNELHVGRFIPVVGRVLMGAAAITVIFLLISGTYLYLANGKREFKKEKFKHFWFKWHKDLSLILIPYVLIFFVTGAFMGFMLPNSAPFAKAATNLEESSMRKLVAPIIFPRDKAPKSNGEKVESKKISELQQKAKEKYPNLVTTKITIFNYNQMNSQTKFSGYLEDNRALSSKVNRMYITLDSTTGEEIKRSTLDNTHGISQTLSVFYFLHFLSDENFFVRVLFFISSIAMGASIVFGYLIWAEKSLKRHKDIAYFNFFNRFTFAFFFGLIPASALVFCLHWLVPFDAMDRPIWIKGTFYAFWAFTFLYTVYLDCIISVAKFFLTTAGALLIGAIVIHGQKSGMYIWESFQNEIYHIFYVDLALVIFAIIFYLLALNLHKISFFKRFQQGVAGVS